MLVVNWVVLKLKMMGDQIVPLCMKARGVSILRSCLIDIIFRD